MEHVFKPTPRRTLLVRGLAALAGALGLAVVEKKALGPSPPLSAANCGNTLRIYARRWQVHTPVRQPGESAGQGHRLIHHGELLDQPDGDKVGEFCSSRFCLESSFGPNPLAESNLEFHTMKMKDGTLFGMTTGAAESDGEKRHAVLGGTGRFAGARGCYLITGSADHGKPGLIEIVITLAS